MKKVAVIALFGVLITSCVSQKKYTELEELQQNTKSLLDATTVKLNSCNEEKEAAEASLSFIERTKSISSSKQSRLN